MESFFLVVYFIGIVSYGISSAMTAIDRECDLFGVLFIAACTTFGGGILRDLILGLHPPYIFREESWVDLAVCLGAALLVFLFAAGMKKTFVRYERQIARINNIADAIGIGAFAVYGTQVAIENGFDRPFVAVSMGLITGIVGGIIRDLCLNDVPFVMRKRVYAVAVLAGAASYYILKMYFSLGNVFPVVVGVLLTFGLRICATIFKWNIPVAIRFSKLTEAAPNGRPRKAPIVPNRKQRKK